MIVIFRKDQSGCIVALFPEVAEHQNPAHCGCYEAGEPSVSISYARFMEVTRAAKPKEYRPLLRELRKKFDFDFQIAQQASDVMHDRRATAAKQHHGQPERVWLT
jgi:hypothetical protein